LIEALFKVSVILSQNFDCFVLLKIEIGNQIIDVLGGKFDNGLGLNFLKLGSVLD